jgi:DNA-binding CsgD family transcriptional regulator
MPWLDEADLQAVRGASWVLDQARSAPELRAMVLSELAALIPADVLSWNELHAGGDRIEHEAVPQEAEPPGAFARVAPTEARHPLLHAHAVHPGPAVRLTDAVERRALHRSELYGDLLHRSGAEYGMSIGVSPRAHETVVLALGRHERQFSERDRDVLDLARPVIEGALQDSEARARLVRALASAPPPGTAVLLLDHYGEIEHSNLEAERWLAEHFGPAEHSGWLPGPVASWLALPPRPPLVSVRDGRRLTIRLLPGDPHALLLEETVERFRPSALAELGLTAREREVLEAGRGTGAEGEIAGELFLSRHAVWDRLERLEQKLGVRTLAGAVAAALRASA